MMDFVNFDPKKHKGRQLYELQSKETDGRLLTVTVPVNTPFEQASQTPWYYVVEAEE